MPRMYIYSILLFPQNENKILLSSKVVNIISKIVCMYTSTYNDLTFLCIYIFQLFPQSSEAQSTKAELPDKEKAGKCAILS